MVESTKQRQAFDLYWQLGPDRSIDQLHKAMSAGGRAPNVRTLYAWSSRCHWQDRLADLEREARRAAAEARIRAMEEMYERQAQEGLLLQQKGAEWLMTLEEEISPEAAIRAIVEGAKLERQARGEPGERLQETSEVSYDFRSYTNEELRVLIELGDRDKGGAGGAGKA